MKKLYLIMAFLLCLALCGCVNAFKTPSQDNLMADIFNAIEDKDYDYARQEMGELISGEELDNVLPAMSDYIQGTITEYTKIGYYYHIKSSISSSNKTETQTLTYNVKTQYNEYVVEMVLLNTEGGWKVYGYHVTEASKLPINGYIIDFNNFDVLQLIMLVFSAACIGFVIYTIVICAKSRIRLKALWIILIILVQAGLAFAESASAVDIRVMAFSLDISKLLKYQNGDYIFTLIIPVGAILFLCLRKHLIASAEAYNQRKAAANNPPADTAAPAKENLKADTDKKEKTP